MVLPTTLRSRTDLLGGKDGALLFMAWVRPSSPSSGWHMIAVNMPGFRYIGVNSSHKIQLMVRDVVNNVNYWPVSIRTIPVDKWTHIAFVLRGGIGYEMYIDGKLDRKVDNPNLGIVAQSGATTISGVVTPPDEYWDGEIDSVRLYHASI